jgi:hypothetical protein
MEEYNTYFLDESEHRIGSLIGLIPFTKGMFVEMKEKTYIVDEVQFKIGKPFTETNGFYVFCKENK